MEPRAVLTMPDPTGRLVVYCTTQAPHHIRQAITEELGLPVGAVRVVAPDVGGGFGTKGKHYPEETVLPWAAQRLGRPHQMLLADKLVEGSGSHSRGERLPLRRNLRE